MIERKVKQRNAEVTRNSVLQAAIKEFAMYGLGGARVDRIAQRAKLNKRMIYHYFGNKSRLFEKVIEKSYLDIRSAESMLDLDKLPARDALVTLINFTWQYYLKNPGFIRLVNSENLHKAKHLKNSLSVQNSTKSLVSQVQNLLDRGVKEGVFRPRIDPVQLIISIAALGYYYLTNRYTGSIIFERDLMDKEALAERLAFNTETILRMVCISDSDSLTPTSIVSVKKNKP